MKFLNFSNKIPFNKSMNSNLNSYHGLDDWTEKTEFKIVFGITMGTLCFVTVIGNLLAIYRYRKASLVGNLFIISLACADLIVGCFVMPVASVYTITKTWNLSEPLCQIWLAADYTASTASILNLLTLSLDRYWSITSPLKYLGKRTKSRALIMIGFAWSISLLWVIPIIGWSYFFNNNIRTVPPNKCNTEYNENLAFKVITALANFYIPLFAMICINIKVYLVIQKRYQSPIMKYTSSNANIQNPLSFASIKYNVKNQGIYFDTEVIYPIANDTNSDRLNPYRISSFKNQTTPKSLTTNTLFFQDSQTTSATQNKNKKNNYQTIVSCPSKMPLKCNMLRDRTSDVSRQNSSTGSDNVFSADMSIDGSVLNLRNRNVNKINNKNSHGTKSSFFDSLHSKKKERMHINKQEKAFKQLIAIVAGFTICFTPYFVVYLLVAICPKCVPDEIFTVCLWLGYLNSTINPFLYALSSKQATRSTVKKKAFYEQNIPSNINNFANSEQFSAIYVRHGVSRKYTGNLFNKSPTNDMS